LERSDGKKELNVTVPPNCTARFIFDEKGNGAEKRIANKIGKKTDVCYSKFRRVNTNYKLRFTIHILIFLQ
jgi:hypothetical protein